MSKETDPPGTVAVATVKGVKGVRVMRGDGIFDNKWYTNRPVAGSATTFPESCVTDVHPLVVLDLGDAPMGNVPRDALPLWLRRLASDMDYRLGTRTPRTGLVRWIADQIEAQTKPLKPEEPTGLGAVVEDAKGNRWVRAFSLRLAWTDTLFSEDCREYADIDAVRVLSEGVTG